jgi:hypothetical protein
MIHFCKFPQWKSPVLNCTAYSCRKEMCITLCFTCLFDRQKIKLDCMTSDEVYLIHDVRTVV